MSEQKLYERLISEPESVIPRSRNEAYLKALLTGGMSDDSALNLLVETGVIEPLADGNGTIYTDANGVIYTL